MSKKGRGAQQNPSGRFESYHITENEGLEDGFEDHPLPTEFIRDSSRSILSTNKSPDVGFDVSLNPYRGCEHGCIYCYARPTHEYLGYSAGLDFETKILFKQEAPALLNEELRKKSWTPRMIGFSGVTDPYQPVERRMELTRKCLEVLRDFRNPVGIVTKNRLVTRDLDLLRELSTIQACRVHISMTTLDRGLAMLMEPRTSGPLDRLRAMEELSGAGIPVGVFIAPVIPGLNDHEIPAILEKASAAGAQFAHYVMVRLPYGVSELFNSWLDQHFPDRKSKIIHRIESLRGGNLNDSRFGSRMRGSGICASQTNQMFNIFKKKYGYQDRPQPLDCTHFRIPTDQPELMKASSYRAKS